MVNERYLGLGQTRSIIRELFEYGKKLRAERGADKVFDFSLGNPNAPVPDCVTESIKKHLSSPDVHGYTSAQGDLEVRKKIADYNNSLWNIGFSHDEIYMTTGASGALIAALAAINYDSEGEIIAIAPFFPEYRIHTGTAGAKLVVVQSKEDFSLDLNAIETAINENTRAIIVNSPNNPSGVVYGEADLIALAELLNKKQRQLGTDIYIVTDEPYREISYGVEVHSPICYYDNTIMCYAFSKTLSLAGERIGYVAVSPKLHAKEEVYAAICGAARAFGYVCAPSLFQFVVADCLGKTADLEIYKNNHDLLCQILDECGFSYAHPDGAFYLFVKCPVEPQKFFELCKEQGLLVVPSESFGTPGYVRIAYCIATDVIVRSAPYFKRVAELCRNL